MNIYTIDTGFFKLDGGAMFGIVPKTIWQRTNPADENNMCTWAMRCLLIESGNRLILFDTGLGDKQDEKFFRFLYPHGETTLENSLKKHGFHPDDITDVVFTHLHFDHCGGAVKRDGDKLLPAFKNARYWSNEKHWRWALEPNVREKNSFLKENFVPIQESGQLHYIEEGSSPFADLGLDFLYVDGHTERQMLPRFSYKGKTVVYVADLLPSVGHLPLAYVMGYDVRPLQTLREKENFLQTALAQEYVLIFEHDPVNECCTLKDTPKGPREAALFSLTDL
jgi:glyoxylase-like metal-dependent hydrolase (beta-lactamase superfamily II)